MEKKQEVIIVNIPYNIRVIEYAGHYLSRFYTQLRDEAKIWANKCPYCKRIILPPRIVCAFCKAKIEDVEKNWVQLNDTGTVMFPFGIPVPEMDWRTNEPMGNTIMGNAFVRLDGGDEWTLLGHLIKGFKPTEEAPEGMRVRAVWRPKEERVGKMSDIMYFEPFER